MIDKKTILSINVGLKNAQMPANRITYIYIYIHPQYRGYIK